MKAHLILAAKVAVILAVIYRVPKIRTVVLGA